jgi:hypothetical protein
VYFNVTFQTDTLYSVTSKFLIAAMFVFISRHSSCPVFIMQQTGGPTAMRSASVSHNFVIYPTKWHVTPFPDCRQFAANYPAQCGRSTAIRFTHS